MDGPTKEFPVLLKFLLLVEERLLFLLPLVPLCSLFSGCFGGGLFLFQSDFNLSLQFLQIGLIQGIGFRLG